MGITRRALLATVPLLGATGARAATEAPVDPVRIGVLTDLSGPYRDVTGPTSVACVRQAAAEFTRMLPGIAIEVIAGDHQNKADIGVAIVREWFDRGGVDMVIDVPTSSVALAVAAVAAEKNKVYVNSGAGTPDLTGSACNANTVKWTFDTYMLAKSTATAVVREGGQSWFFITPDYVFGHQLQRDATRFLTASGGTVLGAAVYPFPETTDFSSYLVQARASGAKVIAFCNAGNDTVNSIKQAREFGLGGPGQMLAGLLASLGVVHSLGLEAGRDLLLTESFYWNLNQRTRAFTSRLLAGSGGTIYPNMAQAGCYAGALHYLKAVAALGVAQAREDGAGVVAEMKRLPYDDDAFGQGLIRADGRALVPAYLFRVKSPPESTGPWDLYRLIATLPGEQAAPPLAEEHCKLIPA